MMKRIGARLGVSLGALLLVLLVAEVVVRFTGVVQGEPVINEEEKIWLPSSIPDLGSELKPNTSGLMASKLATINARGFRDRLYPVDKGDGTFRIVGLGDSMTFGVGVALQDTYLKQLESRLNGSGGRHPKRRYEVMNLGVPGYDSIDELIYLKHRGLPYKPDLVTVGFYVNDAESDEDEERFQDQSENYAMLLEIPAAWQQMSKVLSFLIQEYYFRQAKHEFTAHVRHIFFEQPSGQWDECVESLQEIVRMGKTEGFEVLVLVLPMLPGNPRLNDFDNYFLADVHAHIRKRFTSEGIPFVDMLDAYKGHSFERVAVPMDGHPNERGHQIMAARLYQEIIARGLVSGAR